MSEGNGTPEGEIPRIERTHGFQKITEIKDHPAGWHRDKSKPQKEGKVIPFPTIKKN